MGIKSVFREDKHIKGFTLVEMSVVCLVFAVILNLNIAFITRKKKYDHPQQAQVEALLSMKQRCDEFGVCFNAKGHIKKGQSITRNNLVCVYQLGWGRVRCD